MTPPKTDTAQAAGRRQFLLLAALFAAPIIAAAALYLMPQLQPQGRTHYGELLAPARPLPDLSLLDVAGQPLAPETLRGRWTLFYLGSGPCARSCEDKLFQVRQVRTLLNEKRLRVQRIYLAEDAAALAQARAQLEKAHPDLRYVSDAGAAGARARDFFQPREADAIYLTDPLGNWLMVYPAASEYKGMLKDLKRLLRLSQIG